MSRNNQSKILEIVWTDNTFRKVGYLVVDNDEIKPSDDYMWQGKCIFCNRKLCVSKTGILQEHATVEHIQPRSKGGTNDTNNLAIACRHCNGEKGRRHDIKKANKQRALEIVEKLQRKRMKRWRQNVQEKANR